MVLYEGAGGGSSTGSTGPFSHYPANASAILDKADIITGKVGGVNGVKDDVDTKNRPAESAVSGLVQAPVKGAPKPVKQKATKVAQTTLFGGGCVRYWGTAVQSFNRAVDKLNSEYLDAPGGDAAKQALLVSLKQRYAKLEGKLDNKASKTASMLKKGPDDEKSVLKLFGAGALPISATLAFPGVDFSKANPRKALKALEGTPLGTLLLTGSKKDVAQWLKSHPELTKAVTWLLKRNGLEMSALEKALVEGQAHLDAQILTGSEEGSVRDATARLRLINATAQGDGRINEAGAVFVDAWLDTIGPDRLTELPTGVAQDALKPIANAILLRTNPEQLEPGASDRGWPPVVQELLTTRVGSPSEQGRIPDADGDGDIDGLDQFSGWAKLLDSSTVKGGDGFSEALGHQAIQVRQDMNATLVGIRQQTEGGVPAELGALLEDDSSASDLLSVTARNQDASSRLLLDTHDRRALLGMNWNDASGAADLIEAGTDRDSTDGSTLSLQRDAAEAIMKDVARHRDIYRGYAGEDALGGSFAQDAAMQEEISDAVVDMGVTWGDTFLNPTSGEHDDQVDPGDIQLSRSDMEGFLNFVARDDEADTLRFQTGVRLVAQYELTEALENHDQGDIELAMNRAGRFDGMMRNALYHGQLEDGAEATDAATQAEVRVAKAAKVAALLAKAGGTGAAAAAVPTGSLPLAAAVQVGSEGVSQIINSVADDQLDAHQYAEEDAAKQLKANLSRDVTKDQENLVLMALMDVDDRHGDPITTDEDVREHGRESSYTEAKERYEKAFGTDINDGKYYGKSDEQFQPTSEHEVHRTKEEYERDVRQVGRARRGDSYPD